MRDSEERQPAKDGGGWTSRAGLAACFLLAVACLLGASYQTGVIKQLLREGERAPALVVGIEASLRGSKKAVYLFVTARGEEIRASDAFDLYLVRPRRDESLTVIYDPEKPDLVIADLGIFTWQGPMIFWSGAIGLTALGILLYRSERQRREE